MTLTVNGIDVSGYVTPEGYKITRSDVEDSNAGRTLNGTMQRKRVAVKYRLDVTLRLLPKNLLAPVLNAITSETFIVTYSNPWDTASGDSTRQATCYSNNYNVQSRLERGGNVFYNLSFPLIEV